ncbi:MAG: type II secretion system F family protein [Planctomycetales bacterium]|nr:type II secretion system F family protein [Planctomycetales bacterium]
MSSPSNDDFSAADMLEPHGALTLDALQLRLAAQLAPARWRGSLVDLAKRIEGGQPLEEVFASMRSSQPAELRCLLDEAVRVPAPSKLILDSLRARRTVADHWQLVLGMISYPLLLLAVALIIAVTFSFAMRSMIDFQALENLGMTEYARAIAVAEDQHHAILGLGLAFGWTLLILVTLVVAGPPWAWTAVIGGMMLIGYPLRWMRLQEILQRFELFMAQGISPAAAVAATSRSFARSGQAPAAAAIAQRVAAGMPLGRALSASALSDGLCRPALSLLDQRGSELPTALAETSSLLGRLVEQRCRVLSSVLPPFLLILVGTIVWAAMWRYVMLLLPLLMGFVSSMV